MSQNKHFGKKIRFGVVALMIGLLAGQSLTALLYIVLARYQGPKAFGQLMTWIGVAGFLVVIADFGSTTYIVRRLNQSTKTRRRVIARWAKTRIVTALTVYLLIFVMTKLSGTDSMNLLGGMSSFFGLTCSQVSQAVLIGIRKPAQAGVTLLIERFGTLTGFLTAVFLGLEPLRAFAITQFVIPVVVLIGVLGLIGTKKEHYKPILRIEHPWRESKDFGISSVSNSLIMFDVPIIRLASSALDAGIYSSVNRWIQPYNTIAASYSRVILPLVAAATSNQDVRRILGTAFRPLMLISISTVALASQSAWLVDLVLGRNFESASPVFAILLISALPMMANQVMSVTLQGRNHEKYVARVAALNITIQIVAISFGSYVGGAKGASVGYLLGQSVYTIILARKLIRVLH